MAILATNAGNHRDFEPIEAGTYAARCISMIEIGTITEYFQNEEKRQKKVRITWELPTELKVFKEENGPQPYVVSKEFTLSMHEKATLRHYLEGWRGQAFTEQEARAFDIEALLGKPCMLSITHKVSQKNGKTYADISGVSKLMKGMECPPQINPTTILSYDKFNWDVYGSLPQFLKEKIAESEEFKAINDSTLGSVAKSREALNQNRMDAANAEFAEIEDMEPAYEGDPSDLPF